MELGGLGYLTLVIARGAWWSNNRIPAINEKPAVGAIYKSRCSSY